MASIYKHRKGWQASVTVNGVNAKRNFDTANEARRWASAQEAAMLDAHAPRLGGPTKCTVAQLLFDYAQLYTIEKKSIKSELDRINRYLVADGLPALNYRVGPNNGVELFARETQPKALPRTFEEHKAGRAAARQGTNQFRERLASMRVCAVSTDTLREFLATMHAEGLSGSTRQKEAALLKHAFNIAAREWNWCNFKSPFVGLKIPKGGPGRDRILRADEEVRLLEALEASDNVFILPYLVLGIETTGRRSDLLKVDWRDVNLDERWILYRDTKNGDNLTVPLTKAACALLRALPRDPSDTRVLPTTAEAIDAAWERACERAGIEDLHKHDLRHTGATRHARKVRNPQMLKKITGHRSAAMLERYIHFMHEDILEALDEPDKPPRRPEPAPVATPGPASIPSEPVDANWLRRQRKAARLNGPRAQARDTPAATERADNVITLANFRAARTG